MPRIARRKENDHAHKTKLDAEKGDSDAENKVGWQENSKKKRRAVARKAVATKKVQTAAAGAQAAPTEVRPTFTTE